jgi:hypothetical protein
MSEDKHVVDELEDRTTEDRDSTVVLTSLVVEAL